MSAIERLSLVLVLLVATTLIWILMQRFGGGISQRRSQANEPVSLRQYPFALGGTATLMQFSTAVCSNCAKARKVLGELAESMPGVKHVEIKSEEELDLVRDFSILRAPTTIILDARGNEVARVSGVPNPHQVTEQINQLPFGTGYEI